MGGTSVFWFLVYLLNAQSRFLFFFFDELTDKKGSKDSICALLSLKSETVDVVTQLDNIHGQPE